MGTYNKLYVQEDTTKHEYTPINDTTASDTTTYSSNKLETKFTSLNNDLGNFGGLEYDLIELFDLAIKSQLSFSIGDRGSVSGTSVNRTTSTINVSSDLIIANDFYMIINNKNSKYKFTIRGYTNDESNSGVFVSGGGSYYDKNGNDLNSYTSSWSNTYDSSIVLDNRIGIFNTKKTNVKYYSVIVSKVSGGSFTTEELAEVNDSFRLYKGLFNDNKSKSFAYIFAMGEWNLDTINKTLSCSSTFTFKCGNKTLNNITIDISNFDASKHGTFYFDFTDGKLKWKEYKTVLHTEFAILGNSWAKSTSSAYGSLEAIYNLNTNRNCLVNGRLQTFNNEYYKAKCIIMGDSIAYGKIDSTARTENTINYILEKLSGIKCSNVAISGSKVTYKDAKDTSLDSLCLKVSDYNFANYDYAIIFMGTNDYGNSRTIGSIDDMPSNSTGNTFYSAYKYALEKMISDNPYIHITLVTPTNRSYITDSTKQSGYAVGDCYTKLKNGGNGTGNTLGDYCDAIVNIANLYNVQCIDLRKNSPINFKNFSSVLTEDDTNKYIHPNSKGYELLNNRIAKMIMNEII